MRCAYCDRNGDEWYRLKRGVQQAMMRPQSVYAYIPLNEQVANDFVVHIRKQKKPDGSLVDFRNDVAKWSLECNFCKLSYQWPYSNVEFTSFSSPS